MEYMKIADVKSIEGPIRCPAICPDIPLEHQSSVPPQCRYQKGHSWEHMTSGPYGCREWW